MKDVFNPDFFIIHKVLQAEESKNFHYHDSFEIYVALNDGKKYFVNDKVYPLQKGDIFVFNHLDLHNAIVPSNTPNEIYVIHFTPQYVRELSSSETNLLECFLDRGPDFSHRVHLNPEQFLAFTALCEKAYAFESKPCYGWDVSRKTLLAEILIMINTFYRTAEHSGTYVHEIAGKKIAPVIEYINKNIRRDISLRMLARTFFMNQNHLNKIFKKATGYTVKEYIISRRIIIAKQYLLENTPVALVAETTGFRNNSHFIRTFKKLVGITPKQYAKKQDG